MASSTSNIPEALKPLINPFPVIEEMQPVWFRCEAKDLASIQANVRSHPGDEFHFAGPNMDELIRAKILHDLDLAPDPGSVRAGGMKVFRPDADGQLLPGILCAVSQQQS